MNKKLFSLIPVLIFLIAGCAHVVSEKHRNMAEKEISIPLLFKSPDRFKDQVVILGGVIASSLNAKEGTYLEIVEKPIDSRGKPEKSDISRGRFIVLHEGFIDTAIYYKGRHVTVAGKVLGKKVRPLGEIDYNYLFLKSLELHLVKPAGDLPVSIGIGIGATF